MRQRYFSPWFRKANVALPSLTNEKYFYLQKSIKTRTGAGLRLSWLI
jgi:hypothetical protein